MPARYKDKDGIDFIRKKSLYRQFSERDISHLNFDNSQNFLLCNEDHAIAYIVNSTTVKVDHFFNKFDSGTYVLNGTGQIKMGNLNCKLKKPINLDIKTTLDMGLNTANTLNDIVDNLSTNSSMADVIIHDLEIATGVVVNGVKEVGYFFFDGAHWIIIGIIGVLTLGFILYLVAIKQDPATLQIQTSSVPTVPTARTLPSFTRRRDQYLSGNRFK